jgi:transposase
LSVPSKCLSKTKVMKQFKTFIGVDISKQTLDICLLQEPQIQHFKIANEKQAIEQLLAKLNLEQENTCITMENTGRYNVKLLSVLTTTSFTVYVVAPLHIARKSGLIRGKNDKIDSIRIAKFAQKEYCDLNAWVPKRQIITDLQILLTERKRIVNCIKDYKTSAQELEVYEKSFAIKTSQKVYRSMMKVAEKNLAAIEQAIEELIGKDDVLDEQAKFITSVKGVGKVLCWYLLVRTNEFKNINDPRKLACYAGVVPFDISSGSSIRKGNRVSLYADKELKSLLHLSAMRVIQLEGELKEYYKRKVAEGKNKMSVLNAIRNKLIHRICAVVSQKRFYKLDLVLS